MTQFSSRNNETKINFYIHLLSAILFFIRQHSCCILFGVSSNLFILSCFWRHFSCFRNEKWTIIHWQFWWQTKSLFESSSCSTKVAGLRITSTISLWINRKQIYVSKKTPTETYLPKDSFVLFYHYSATYIRNKFSYRRIISEIG